MVNTYIGPFGILAELAVEIYNVVIAVNRRAGDEFELIRAPIRAICGVAVFYLGYFVVVMIQLLGTLGRVIRRNRIIEEEFVVGDNVGNRLLAVMVYVCGSKAVTDSPGVSIADHFKPIIYVALYFFYLMISELAQLVICYIRIITSIMIILPIIHVPDRIFRLRL